MFKSLARTARRLVGKERPHDRFLREFSFPSDIKERYSDVDITQWGHTKLNTLMNHCGHLLREKPVLSFRVLGQWDDLRRHWIKFSKIQYKKHCVLHVEEKFVVPCRGYGSMIALAVKEVDTDFVPYLLYMSEFYQQYLEMKDFYEESIKVMKKHKALTDIKEN